MLNKAFSTNDDKVLFGQSLALSVGTFIGWREVISEINYFCDVQGVGLSGLTSFSGNLTTNPILTPCFWGSIAFVVALVWSLYILSRNDPKEQEPHQKNLFWLLLGSTIFAWANTAYTFYKYYFSSVGTDHFGCPASRINNPYTTACFMGAVAFLVSLIFAYLYLKRSKPRQ